MVDNIAVTPGSGATVAADDVSGVLHQRIKIALGADGVFDGDVSSTLPMPANITQVAGAAVKTGNGTASGAMRVTLPTDGTGVVGLIAGTAKVGQVAIDQTTPGTTNLVQLPTGAIVAGTATTRTADTNVYAQGDLVANSVTAGSVTFPTISAARGTDVVTTALRCRLKKSGTSITKSIFRVHFYNVLPSVTNGDNAAWLTTEAGYCGSFDVNIDKAFSDASEGVGVPLQGSTMTFAPVSGTSNLYYLIEARDAYIPISAEVFTPYLEVQ